MGKSSDWSKEIGSEEIRDVVSTAAKIPLLDTKDSVRFTERITVLAGEYLVCEDADEEPEPTVFILCDHHRLLLEKFGGDGVQDPLLNPIELTGKLLFLNRDASIGTSIDLPCEVNDLNSWVLGNDLEHSTIIIAYPAAGKLVSRDDWIGSTSKEIPIKKSELSLDHDNLAAQLVDFNRDNISSPQDCEADIWRISSQYVPDSRAEAKIQEEMRRFLKNRYNNVARFKPEADTSSGRIDIKVELLGPVGQGWLPFTIIELKVLRSFGYNAEEKGKGNAVNRSQQIKAITDGFEQVDNYCQTENLSTGFLEVFDMRKDKDESIEQEQGVVAAQDNCNHDVRFSMRPVYASSSEARKAGAFFGS